MAKRFLKECPPDNNPLSEAMFKVEQCMRDNEVSFSVLDTGTIAVTIKGHSLYVTATQIPRVFDDERLYGWDRTD